MSFSPIPLLDFTFPSIVSPLFKVTLTCEPTTNLSFILTSIYLIKPILSVPLPETKSPILMERIIRYLRKLRDRRLRKYCVKQAAKFCEGTERSPLYVMGDIYYFLTGPHTDE